MPSRMITQNQGQRGVNLVEGLVLGPMRARWQALDAQNDDGVDGLILFQDTDGFLTGQIAQVQVKSLQLATTGAGNVKIPIGKPKLERLARGWHASPGAVILVWVDPSNQSAYWTNLRDPGSIVDGSIVVSLSNRFDKTAAGAIRMLCGTLGPDNLHKQIISTRSDSQYIRPTSKLRADAKEFYKSIGTLAAENTGLGNVEFTRIGWRHITRPTRPLARIVQSLQLLGIAKRIVREVSRTERLRVLDDKAAFYGLTAQVFFPHRDAAIIRVILLQLQPTNPSDIVRTWFYSVYERRRRKGILGEATVR